MPFRILSLALGAGGRGFESRYPDEENIELRFGLDSMFFFISSFFLAYMYFYSKEFLKFVFKYCLN